MISGVIAVLLLFLSPGTPLRSDFTRVSWNLGENFRVQSQYKYNRATKCMSTTLDEDPATDKSILTILDQSQNERTDQQKPKNLLSKDWELPNAIKDIRCYLSVNDSFVPVIGVHKASTFIKLRSYLFGQGVYPGVEYKILNITKFSSSDISDHSDSRDKSDGSKVTSSELSSLQGLLERGQRDKILFNDDSTGWIGRLFGGPMQLIQVVSNPNPAFSLTLRLTLNLAIALTLTLIHHIMLYFTSPHQIVLYEILSCYTEPSLIFVPYSVILLSSRN
jgi:hypothetical protein